MTAARCRRTVYDRHSIFAAEISDVFVVLLSVVLLEHKHYTIVKGESQQNVSPSKVTGTFDRVMRYKEPMRTMSPYTPESVSDSSEPQSQSQYRKKAGSKPPPHRITS